MNGTTQAGLRYYDSDRSKAENRNVKKKKKNSEKKIRSRSDRFNDVIPTKSHSLTTIVFKLTSFVDRKL